MTLERCRRILCCDVRQEDGRCPTLQALLEVATTIGRLQRLPPGATLRARPPVLCVSQSRRPLLCLPPRFHRPPGRRPAGLLSDRHRRTVLVPVILWIEVDYVPSLAFQFG